MAPKNQTPDQHPEPVDPPTAARYPDLTCHAMPSPAAPDPDPRPRRPAGSARRPKRGSGEGYISQRKDRDGRPLAGQWRGELQVGTRPDGRPDIRYVSGISRRDVQDKLLALRQQRTAGRLPPRQSRTLQQHAERWLADVVQPARKPGTYQTYHDQLHRYALPAIGHYRLADLTAEPIRRLYADLAIRPHRPLKRKSIESLHRALHALLTDARRLGLLTTNPADGLPIPGQPADEMHCLTADQARHLLARLDAHPEPYATLITLALASGARKGEILALRRADVDTIAGRISIQRALSFTRGGPHAHEPKTRRARRVIELDAHTTNRLRHYLALQARQKLAYGPDWRTNPALGDLALTHPDGRYLHPSGVDVHWKRALADAGLPHAVRFHDLRHTHATLALADGQPVKVVSERLGHASVRTTLDLYAHVLPGQDRALADRMGGLLYG